MQMFARVFAASVVVAIASVTAVPQGAQPAKPERAFTYELLWESPKAIGGRTVVQVVEVDLNDSGAVVFLARDDAKRLGIYTPDRLVAAAGSKLPNGQDAISVSSPDINDAGQIAYGATYAPCKPENPTCQRMVAYFVDNALAFEMPIGTMNDSFRNERFMGIGVDPEWQPALTSAGQIVLANVTLGLLLNGKPVLARDATESSWMANGEAVDVLRFGPPPTVLKSGEIVFAGITPVSSPVRPRRQGIYSSTRGRIGDLLDQPFANRQMPRIRINNSGLLAHQERLKRPAPANARVLGFNDANQFLLWQERQETGKAVQRRILLDDRVVVNEGDPYTVGPSGATRRIVYREPTGFIESTLSYPSAVMNNVGAVLLVGEEAPQGTKQGKAFVILARPK